MIRTAQWKIARRLMRGVWAAIAATAALVASQPAWAEYPDRPIKYVLSSGAGSAPDTLMRLILEDVGKRLGTAIVIENKSGGGGLIAMQAIASATPDGYTIGHGNTQTLGINPSLSKAGLAAANHVDLIVQIGYTPNLLSVSPSLPVKSVGDLIAYAKANPGKLVFGSAGNGTSGHVGAELFKYMTKTQMVHAPYKTAPAAVNDVMAGHVDLVFDNIAGSLAAVKGGKLKPLAVTSLKRSPLVPNLPTVAQAGVPGFEVIAWSGIIGPKGMPSAVLQRLNATVNQSLRDPHIVQGMRELGYEVVGGTPAEFSAWVSRERSKWADVIRASGAATD